MTARPDEQSELQVASGRFSVLPASRPSDRRRPSSRRLGRDNVAATRRCPPWWKSRSAHEGAGVRIGVVVSAGRRSPRHSQGFPNKLMRIIVPFTPGGSNDVVAREIATGLQETAEPDRGGRNKPGGGGTIAYQFVAKSPPDGAHHDDRAGLVHHGAASVAQPGLQPDHGVRADHPRGRRAVRAGGAVEPAGAFAEGTRSSSPRAPRQADVRLGRPRHAAASRRRTVQVERRRRHDPRAVSRRYRRDSGPARRVGSTCSSARSIRSCR